MHLALKMNVFVARDVSLETNPLVVKGERIRICTRRGVERPDFTHVVLIFRGDLTVYHCTHALSPRTEEVRHSHMSRPEPTRIDAIHQWGELERALISMKLINEVEGNVT